MEILGHLPLLHKILKIPYSKLDITNNNEILRNHPRHRCCYRIRICSFPHSWYLGFGNWRKDRIHQVLRPMVSPSMSFQNIFFSERSFERLNLGSPGSALVAFATGISPSWDSLQSIFSTVDGGNFRTERDRIQSTWSTKNDRRSLEPLISRYLCEPAAQNRTELNTCNVTKESLMNYRTSPSLKAWNRFDFIIDSLGLIYSLDWPCIAIHSSIQSSIPRTRIAYPYSHPQSLN